MKALFYWLLKRYSSTESERIKIIRILDDKVSDDYNEQTTYGNVYNHFIEFVIANPFVVKCVVDNDKESLAIIKSGINTSYDEALRYISYDQAFPSLKLTKKDMKKK